MEKDNRYNYFIENFSFDYILEVTDGNDFLQIVSSMGGDITTNRVYGSPNGKYESFTATER